MKRRNLLLTLLISLCATGLFAAPSMAQDKVTPDEARKIAKDAYIFHYPLVMYYRSMYQQALDPKSGVGLGNWLHLGTSSPKDTTIVTPNNDSPYSYAWVDLRAEPWVVTLPKIEKDRFYTSQWNDLWGYVLENAGSVFDGNDGGSLMLAPPDWQGEMPAGIKRVVKGDSNFLGTLTRTQLKSADDMPNVKKIQGEYKLEPLSAFLGQTAPVAASEIDWMAWEEGAEKTDAFWSYANFLLQFTTPNSEDASLQEAAAKIGIAAGQAWDPDALDPELRNGVAMGMKDAQAELADAASKIVDAGKFFRTRADSNADYLSRAVGVLAGIFGNWESVSVYYALLADAQNQPLDGGKNSYVLTFSKDHIPPVEYFWSVTMYNLPQRFLIENPIDRYSIGNATPGLQTESDGAITLYLSKDSPGKDNESNWLPAPDGAFWMVLRTYGPGKAILDKTYKVPPITPVK